MNYFQKISELITLDGVSTDEICAMLEVPKLAEQGDAALPCFRLAKVLRKAPPAIAAEIAANLPPADFLEKVEVVGGYLNFFLDKLSVARSIKAVVAAGADYGKTGEGQGKTICIDYSSVNIAKPFHIGHLSTTAIGAALYRMYRFLGYNAVGINHLGDWGTQFGKMISAYKRWGDRDTVEKGGVVELQRLYVKFHREAELNPELDDEARAYFRKIEEGDTAAVELFEWFKKITLAEVEKVYERLDVHFDSYAGESFYSDKMQPVIDKLQEKGLLVESDGAEVVRLDDFGMPPCMIRKADGATLYATRDLAAAYYRKKTYDFDKCLYVVAYQQNLHFQQFFKVLELLGEPWAKDLVHVAFGMVSLEEGAMATRKGNVVWLADVLNESVKKARAVIDDKSPDFSDEEKDSIAESVGVGAVVYGALFNGRIKDIVFSYEKVLNFDGETAPYLQYTHARARSVLRRAARGTDVDFSGIANPEAFEVVKQVLAFTDAVRDGLDKFEPCVLTRYLVDLAQKFNRFYLEHRIADAPEGVKNARLLLTEAVANVLKTGLGLLGITAPDRM